MKIITTKVLHDIMNTAIKEGVRIQRIADIEYAKQNNFEQSGQPYNYREKHLIEQGVSAVCEILWKIYGGCPMDSIQAIRNITRNNPSNTAGYDNQDYVLMFSEAFYNRKEATKC